MQLFLNQIMSISKYSSNQLSINPKFLSQMQGVNKMEHQKNSVCQNIKFQINNLDTY